MIGMIPGQYRLAAGILAALAVSGALVGAGWHLGSRSEATAHANTRAKHAQEAASRAMEYSMLAGRLREAEAASAATIATIEANRLEAVRNAEASRDAVLRDLRAGRLSVRLPVRACSNMPAAAPAPAAAPGGDGPANIGSGDPRAVALADIQPSVAQQLGIAARADAQLAACQAVIGEYRALTEAAARETGSREPQAGGQP